MRDVSLTSDDTCCVQARTRCLRTLSWRAPQFSISPKKVISRRVASALSKLFGYGGDVMTSVAQPSGTPDISLASPRISAACPDQGGLSATSKHIWSILARNAKNGSLL